MTVEAAQKKTWFLEMPGLSKLGIYLGFAALIVAVFLPFYWIVLSAITPKADLFRLPLRYWPEDPTLENFKTLVQVIPYWNYLLNSIVFATASALISVSLGFLAAYAFARIQFPGSNVIFFTFLMSTALPPISTMLPMFDLFNRLGLVNTYAGLIIIMSSMLIPFSVWILVSFIRQVPVSIEEAAIIDGCSFPRMLVQIVVPVTIPAVSTMFLLNFIISWNELLVPLIFGATKETKTLSVGITELSVLSTSYSKPWELISAMGVTMIVPVVILVLLFQKSIIRGLSQGAIK